jgi:hypothetical protein
MMTLPILGIVVPEPLQFLNYGWFIVHLIGIPAVFLIGMFVAKKRAAAQ